MLTQSAMELPSDAAALHVTTESVTVLQTPLLAAAAAQVLS